MWPSLCIPHTFEVKRQGLRSVRGATATSIWPVAPSEECRSLVPSHDLKLKCVYEMPDLEMLVITLSV